MAEDAELHLHLPAEDADSHLHFLAERQRQSAQSQIPRASSAAFSSSPCTYGAPLPHLPNFGFPNVAQVDSGSQGAQDVLSELYHATFQACRLCLRCSFPSEQAAGVLVSTRRAEAPPRCVTLSPQSDLSVGRDEEVNPYNDIPPAAKLAEGTATKAEPVNTTSSDVPEDKATYDGRDTRSASIRGAVGNSTKSPDLAATVHNPPHVPETTRTAQYGRRSLVESIARFTLWGDIMDSAQAKTMSKLNPMLYNVVLDLLLDCARQLKVVLLACTTLAQETVQLPDGAMREMYALEIAMDSAQRSLNADAGGRLDDLEQVLDAKNDAAKQHQTEDVFHPTSGFNLASISDAVEKFEGSVGLLMDLLPSIEALPQDSIAFPPERSSSSALQPLILMGMDDTITVRARGHTFGDVNLHGAPVHIGDTYNCKLSGV